MVQYDFGVPLSPATISRKLRKKLYTVMQVCVRFCTRTLAMSRTATATALAYCARLDSNHQPSTCNNELNKVKRKAFADKFVAHESAGDYVV